MSALPQTPIVMTEAEYLKFERTSEVKHEFFAGEVFAMTGASEAHNLICANMITVLKNQLRGRFCKVYPSDMRVKIEATRLYTYPDISVVCGDAQFADAEFETLVNPMVIIEVLSPSTERYDRGKKFQQYRDLPSLLEYVLIAQDHPRVEHFRLQETGIWEFTDAKGLAASLELPSIGCTLALVEIYEQVTLADEHTKK